MDFGDILAQWSEAQKKEKSAAKKPASQVSHKKANAPTPEEKELAAQNYKKTLEGQMIEDSKKAINPMELWLRRYGRKPCWPDSAYRACCNYRLRALALGCGCACAA